MVESSLCKAWSQKKETAQVIRYICEYVKRSFVRNREKQRISKTFAIPAEENIACGN